MHSRPQVELGHVLHCLATLAITVLATAAGAILLARVLRRRRLRWTWALLGLPFACQLVLDGDRAVGFGLLFGCLLAALIGRSWHRADLRTGVDHAEAAEQRHGIRHLIRRLHHLTWVRRHGWISRDGLVVGHDQRRLPVTIPVGYKSGTHTLVVGATGSGKTVTETWIATRLIGAGHAAVVIDPKGDQLLHDQLQAAAARDGRRFLEWTPEGPCSYNPYAHGTETELADKALAGEVFAEPHYQRQAQRYLGHAVRAMHAGEVPVDPVSLTANMDPRRLEVIARNLDPEVGDPVLAYLDALTDKQRRELAGVRDRLSILAESDTARWLAPTDGLPSIDLLAAVQERAVVYFRLDADRRVLLAQMLAAAVISDLVTLVAELQRAPVPTVVVVDEFAAVAAGQIARLFGRARSAGISLVLGTQELADLKQAADGLREQVLGNVAAVVAHRQGVPESAELIAGIAGTKPVWVTTDQTDHGLLGHGPSGRGSQRRGWEYNLHPSRIKQLPAGTAAVICAGSGREPTIARVRHSAGEVESKLMVHLERLRALVARVLRLAPVIPADTSRGPSTGSVIRSRDS